MNVPTNIPVRNPRLLDLAVYLTLLVTVGISLVLQANGLSRVVVIVLCLAFGLVHTFGFAAARSPRRIVAYFTMQTLLVTGLIVTSSPSDVFTLLLYILSVQAVLLMSTRAAVAWMALFYVIGSGSALWSRGSLGLINVFFNAAAFFFTGVYGYTLRQAEVARRRNEQLLAELQLAQQQLQAAAVAEERNRLARELHDSAKQQAFALSAQLDAVQSLFERDPLAAKRHLQLAEQLADRLRQELATMILELRPPLLDELDFPAALRQYAAEWSQQSAIAVAVEAQGGRALPREIEQTLFRIVQEALANVARHSQAQHVDVQLEYTPVSVTLTIRDDGHGFDAEKHTAGVGTASMRERAATLPQGTITLDSAPGCGTRVTVHCAA